MHKLVNLTPDRWHRYERLMLRNVYHRLEALERAGRLVAFGAEMEEDDPADTRAIGAVIVILHPDSATAEVVSLFVGKHCRQQGVGGALLAAAESAVRLLGIAELGLTYYSGKASTPALERLLHAGGWSDPIAEALIYHVDGRIAAAPWLRERPLPAGAELFPWRELSEPDAALLRRQEGTLYPPFLSPFKPLGIAADNSVGVRAGGQIIGWSICFRLEPTTVLYDSIFIHPAYRAGGLAFQLLARSVHMQLEARIPRALFAVNRTTGGMFELAARRLGPYAERISEKRVAVKNVAQDRSERRVVRA